MNIYVYYIKNIFISLILFIIPLVGILTSSNILIFILNIELMIIAIILLFSQFSIYLNDSLGLISNIIILCSSACEISLGICLLLNKNKITNNLQLNKNKFIYMNYFNKNQNYVKKSALKNKK